MEKTLTVINSEFTHQCSGCGRVRQVKFTKKLARVKLKCGCGYLSIVPLNYRGQFRKQTNIDALLTIDNWTGRINIIDMSLYGYRFSLIDDPPKALCVCDIMHIEFQLDDKKKSIIKDDVEIKATLNNNKYGVAVINPEDFGVQQKNKGFWLMP